MRFSTWGCDLSSAFCVVLTGAAIATILVVAVSPAAAGWQIVPEIRVSGGDESDAVVNPDSAGTAVPGGTFVEVTPALSARGWVGTRTLLDLGAFATVQRFLNDESRLVYAQTIYASAFQGLGDGFRGRLSATLGYLDDTEIETARRLGAGGELGAALVRAQWSAEIWTGGGSRTYPNLTVRERLDRTATYDEQAWSAGTTLRFSAGNRFGFRADGVRQTTDSPDPLFDSSSWVVTANMNARLAAPLVLTAHGTYQRRTFNGRAEGLDTDEYWQAGLGLRYSLGRGWALSARCGYSDYTWPDGTDESSYRLLAGIERAWGRPDVAPLPSVDIDALTRTAGGSIQKPDANGRACFRVTAVGAGRVSVAGSFNAWDPDAAPLRPAGEGWWEGCVELEPGTYQYAYVIDGEWTTPPEAKAVVEDGFGGRNGILEVLPADM